MSKKIVILSGGLDSTILTYKLVKEFGSENVVALTYNYGQKQIVELEYAKVTCKKLGIEHVVVDLTVLGQLVQSVTSNIQGSTIEMPTIKDVLGDPAPVTYIPNRNAVMLMIATAAAEAVDADAVYLGIQATDSYQYFDTTPEFHEAINAVNALNRKTQIKIMAPFIEMDKAEEIKLGVELGVPFEDTLTCYNPVQDRRQVHGYLACGKCPSCAERVQNFVKAGVKDPTPYFVEYDWNSLLNGGE